MKKVMIVAVLFLGALMVNAQRTPVKTTDLQKSIVNYITKDYAGYIIKDAVKVVENNVISYEVGIVKNTTSETLVFDKDGKFLHKMAVKTGTAPKSGNAPATSKPVQKN